MLVVPHSSSIDSALDISNIHSLEMKDTRIIENITISEVESATTLIARALIDSGATHEAISKNFITQHNLQIELLPQTRSVTGFSGHESKITHTGDFYVNSGTLPTTFIVTELRDKYDIILGMPWIKQNH